MELQSQLLHINPWSHPFMLRAKRDKRAAKAFFKKAIKSSGQLIKVNIDKSGPNVRALDSINKPLSEEDQIEIRQNKCLNNRIEAGLFRKSE